MYQFNAFILFLVAFAPAVGSYGQDQNAVTDTTLAYSDELGFQRRVAPMLARWAAVPYAAKTRSASQCPDTGLPVTTWALEGETIFSPYTGRAYRQGPVGYFGPKARDERGRISQFGGDPLKQDLPPAMARLLLNANDTLARAYLSTPGSTRQQYHFAAKNWARFYPLLAGKMGPGWRRLFHESVAEYREARRPSDGPEREHLSMSHPHDLVGQAGHLLGGNSVDGGTENHKTMWRTSALIYAQHFPDSSLISGYTPSETKSLVKQMIGDYLRRLLVTGNGEYDSQIYYPHTLEAFLNLYDHSTDPELKAYARFALDYFFATYGLKVVDGAVAGGQKRGFIPHAEPSEMETMVWAFFDRTSRDMSEERIPLHQVLTTYRPNKLIEDIYRERLTYPYSLRVSRPFYHMDRANAFQESFYRSRNFGLGNVYMSIVDNPNQQVVWSLIAKGTDGPLAFAGGQQYARTFTGHSPYTQTAHDQGTLILLTADSRVGREEVGEFHVANERANPWHLPDTAQVHAYELANRRKYASTPLTQVHLPDRIDAGFLQDLVAGKKYSAASWLWLPRGLPRTWRGGWLIVEANETLVGIRPLGGEHRLLTATDLPAGTLAGSAFEKQLNEYDLLLVAGKVSGYLLEAAERTDHGDPAGFATALAGASRLDTTRLYEDLSLSYRSLYGTAIDFQYRPHRLKAAVGIDRQPLDFEDWTQGGVYRSRYLTVGEGAMELTNGERVLRYDGIDQ